MPVYLWSQTAASNANSDPTINWAEGQAPSSVNDSARAGNAAIAKYRDDIAGAIVTSGSSTAYTVSSYSVYDSLAHLNGQMIAFTPHVTNAATVTLSVDSLTAKPLRTAPGVELLAGTIIQGTPYVATYNNTDGAFYLQGFFGNPYSIPLGAGMDYWLPIAPNSSFVFPAGQAISRSTYAALFAAMGTTYGVGDGSTTFNLPDKTGRVSAMQEASANRLTSSYFGGASTALGAVGGGESHVLSAAEMPSHIHNTYTNDPGHTHGIPARSGQSPQSGSGNPGVTVAATGDKEASASNTTGIYQHDGTGIGGINKTTSAGSGSAHAIVQPTIICNYILRII